MSSVQHVAVENQLPGHFLALIEGLVGPDAIGTPFAAGEAGRLRRGNGDNIRSLVAEPAARQREGAERLARWRPLAFRHPAAGLASL